MALSVLLAVGGLLALRTPAGASGPSGFDWTRYADSAIFQPPPTACATGDTVLADPGLPVGASYTYTDAEGNGHSGANSAVFSDSGSNLPSPSCAHTASRLPITVSGPAPGTLTWTLKIDLPTYQFVQRKYLDDVQNTYEDDEVTAGSPQLSTPFENDTVGYPTRDGFTSPYTFDCDPPATIVPGFDILQHGASSVTCHLTVTDLFASPHPTYHQVFSFGRSDAGLPDDGNQITLFRTPGAEADVVLNIPDNGDTTPPVANLNYRPDGVAPGEFLFDGLPSIATATGATIKSYAWDFGDGTKVSTTAAMTTVTHRFTQEGDAHVTLTVTDSNGKTGTTTQTLGPHLRVDGVTFSPPVARPNTTITASLTLQNDSTSTLHGVTPSMTSDKPDIAAPAATPTPATADIGPAQTSVFSYPVRTGPDGKATLTVGGSGVTSDGRTATADAKPVSLVVGNPGILVDLVGEQPTPNGIFQVKVTLTDPGADDITNVTYGDPTGLAIENVTPGTATLSTAADTPPTTLHPGEPVALTYALTSGSSGSAVFTTAVSGTTKAADGSDKTVSDTEQLSVAVNSKVPAQVGVDQAAQLAWDQAGQILAGQDQSTQSLLSGAITTGLGLQPPTQAQYEAVRAEGLSPGIAALADDTTALSAYGAGFSEESRRLVDAGATSAGQLMVSVYTQAKDPATWAAMSSAAYSGIKNLPATVLQNDINTAKDYGYLEQAALTSLTPSGAGQGLADTVAKGEQATAALQTFANQKADDLTNEIMSNRALARSDPHAYEKKMGGYVADATITVSEQGLGLALGDGAFKAAGAGLQNVASRIGFTAMERTAATLEAGAGTADAVAGDGAASATQATATGTGTTATQLANLDGAVSKFQQLEVGGSITVEQAAQAGGLLPSDSAKLNAIVANVKADYGVDLEIGVRTSEPLSLDKDVSPKPELIKPKAVSVLDRLLGAPKEAEGYATVYKPTPLSADQIADFETQSPGFTQAYESRLKAQQQLYADFQDPTSSLRVLVDGSKQYPDGITALASRPTTLGSFTVPSKLQYLEQLDDAAFVQSNGITMEYAQGLKAQLQAGYPDLQKVQIQAVTRSDGSVSFYDGLKNRFYGSDLDIQYVRPANGAPWPPGARGQIETDVNAQLKGLSRFPNHGWSDGASDLNTVYFGAAAKFIMGTADPALATQQATALLARYQLAGNILERQSLTLAQQAALSSDPSFRALAQAQSIALHKSALKFAQTQLSDILAYGSGEKILVFSAGDIRVGYTAPVFPHVQTAHAQVARLSAPVMTFTVDTLADAPATGSGVCEAGAAGCTLREAFAEASRTEQPVAITLPVGTITLASPLLSTGSVALTGGPTTITGAGPLIATTGGALALSQVTLTGGVSSDPGGALAADGTAVTLTDTTVSNSRSDAAGGGVWVGDGGSLTLLRATFTADTAVSGGAVEVDDSTLAVSDSTFTGDGASSDGGAIASVGGTLAVTGSTFTDSAAVERGGAVYVDGGTPTLHDDTFTGGVAGAEGGAVYAGRLQSTALSSSGLDVSGGSFTANTARAGGALASVADLTVTGTTFTGNTADLSGGGAILASGVLTVSGASFTGDTAVGNGGSVEAGGPVVVQTSSFADSAAGGLGGSLALVGPADATLTGVTFTTSTATDGGATVWRDGGALVATGTAVGGALQTLNGQDVAVNTGPTAATGSSGTTAAGGGTTGVSSTPEAAGALPFTGAPVQDEVLLGLLLLLAGAGLVGAERLVVRARLGSRPV